MPSCNGDIAFLEVRIQQSVVEFILNHTEQIFNLDVQPSKSREGTARSEVTGAMRCISEWTERVVKMLDAVSIIKKLHWKVKSVIFEVVVRRGFILDVYHLGIFGTMLYNSKQDIE